MPEWTQEDWAAWRANNCRLLDEGWRLGTSFKLDGTVEQWAEKDGVRIRRDPEWDRGPNDEYIYGRAS
jgi:hypothetical protein